MSLIQKGKNLDIQYMEIDVLAVLQQYAGDTGIRSIQKAEEDYAHVAGQLPAEEMTAGLSHAFRSENTPAFAVTVSQSYERGDTGQRADILTRLIDGASPIVLRPLQHAGMACDAGNVVVGLTETGECYPELIQSIAYQVEQEDNEVIDKMSGYYAENPLVAKTLGGSMLGSVLGKLAETR